MEIKDLPENLEYALRRLLSEQNRDPSTPTYGCFDRRYWSWKLVDFPEATYQRNVWPLAWWYNRLAGNNPLRPLILEAVQAGLAYTCRIQHQNGAFDQAFPNENSFGATAFLIDPLIAAYGVVRDLLGNEERINIENCLRQSANFLCHHNETHGHIANHISGAVWSLLCCADRFGERSYEIRAMELLELVLKQQSEEGWFLEYEGADPGYQTLCIHYLAQVAAHRELPKLGNALERAVYFLSWCVHPDGSFGGEYGSRRTSVFYPGGITLLAAKLPLARRIDRFMSSSFVAGTTVGLVDIDVGNLAPLISSIILSKDNHTAESSDKDTPLPWEILETSRDFPKAGFYMRGRGRYYSIFGASNGGVLKVFDRKAKKILLDDGGYFGETSNGQLITTQVTERDRSCWIEGETVILRVSFYKISPLVQKPSQFVILRVLNLSFMRSIFIGNLIKSLLVRMLISGRKHVSLDLVRKVEFTSHKVTVKDRIENIGKLKLSTLGCGRPFVAIHMASSRYYPSFASIYSVVRNVDITELNYAKATEMYMELR